jgi:uncharacterized protein (TIGR02271 family)
MPDKMTMERINESRGAPVYDQDGEKIGAVEEIFYDRQTNQPEWVGIGTGFFGTKRVLVPLESAELSQDGLRVPYTKDHVKDSPDIDSDEIGEQTERELYEYYRLSAPTGARGRDTTRGSDEVTRSEEELKVGKRAVDAGSVRLHKWVETEPVDVDVELERETARVTRERIDEPVDAELGEDEIEVPLKAEEAVAQKQVVAKERVGVEKDVETERTTVTDELRKERVEVEGDAEERR